MLPVKRRTTVGRSTTKADLSANLDVPRERLPHFDGLVSQCTLEHLQPLRVRRREYFPSPSGHWGLLGTDNQQMAKS